MRLYIKLTIFGLFGGLLGFAYYYFFGSQTTSGITSNWYVSIMFGAAVGVLLSLPNTKKEK